MKYEASFIANNNSIYGGLYGYNNKEKAIKEVREMAEGNRFADGDCNWRVYLAETAEIIAEGGMTAKGKRYIEKHLYCHDCANKGHCHECYRGSWYQSNK